MKKILTVLLAVLMICSVFAGCSAKEPTTDDNGLISVDDAKIKESDAIFYIQSMYTPEELGLADVTEDYSFMVASSGVDIDGKKYVKVVANVPVPKSEPNEDGQQTYSMETYGEYYISFDGKKVLMKDMTTGEYVKLENKVKDYSAKGQTVDE